MDVGNNPKFVNDSVLETIITELTRLKHLNLESTDISDNGLSNSSTTENGKGISPVLLNGCFGTNEETKQLKIGLSRLKGRLVDL